MKRLVAFVLIFCSLQTVYGQSWEKIGWTPISHEGRLLYVSEKTLYASIYNSPDFLVPSLIVSSDNGKTWNEQLFLQGYLMQNFWLKSGANLFVVGADDSNKYSYLFKSTDDGKSWNIFSRFPLDNFRSFFGAGDTLIGDYNGDFLMITIDGGKSWVVEYPSYSMYVLPHLFKGVIISTSTYGPYASSNDLGFSWQKFGFTSYPDSSYLSFTYGNKYFFSTSRYKNASLYYTSDFGENWIKCQNLRPGWNKIQLLDDANILYDAVYSDSTNSLYTSKDEGVSWKKIGNDFTNAIDLFSGSEYYFMAGANELWRLSKSALSFVSNRQKKIHFH